MPRSLAHAQYKAPWLADPHNDHLERQVCAAEEEPRRSAPAYHDDFAHPAPA